MLAFFFLRSYFAVLNAPEDYLQGLSSKILYIHVPCAWLAVGIYISMAFSSIAFLIYRNPVYDITAEALSVIGMVFTSITLITGSIWGKPTWGTWWAWDARMTSVLVLFFIYVAYICIKQALATQPEKAAGAAAAFAVVGAINIPIIKLSVFLWSTLHQKSTFFRYDGPSIHSSMLEPIYYTLPFFVCSASIVFVLRFTAILLGNKIKRQKIAALNQYNFNNSDLNASKQA